MRFFYLLLCFFFAAAIEAKEIIKENITNAIAGDWVVVSFDKNYTFYRVLDNDGKILHLEEACIPASHFRKFSLSWKEWALRGSPGSTSQIVYSIDIPMGRLQSFSKKERAPLYRPQSNAFLSTLINLELRKVPEGERKKAGRPIFGSGPVDTRSIWQPKLVFDGRQVNGAAFDAYKARWPHDGTDLSGKMIEIYLPQEGQLYPSYFPYFMQVTGMIGKAKVHIVDSGRGLFP